MKVLTTLKKNKEYRNVYSRGKSFADRYLVIYFLANNLEFCRFGFTVSKKVGNAVTRNRIRRLLKEACRLNNNVFSGGFDLVLVARRSIVSLEYVQVEESLLKLLKKVYNR
jgi:ribonuclease P protein component